MTLYLHDPNDNPISGVTVTSLETPPGQSALSGTTNTSGYVTFYEVYAGAYNMSFSKFGYDTRTEGEQVYPGLIATDTIELQAYGIIVVQVIDNTDTPVFDALVEMIEVPTDAGTQTTTTNETGHVVFERSLAGDYVINASKTGYITNVAEFTLLPGETETLTIRLEPAPRLDPIIIIGAAAAVVIIVVVVVVLVRRRTPTTL